MQRRMLLLRRCPSRIATSAADAATTRCKMPSKGPVACSARREFANRLWKAHSSAPNSLSVGLVSRQHLMLSRFIGYGGTRALHQAAGTSVSLRAVLHVSGGMAAFICMNSVAGYLLDSFDVAFPSSIAALLVLGVVVSFPRSGTVINRALEPAAIWMRSALPCMLVPPFLLPFVVEIPHAEVLPQMLLLCSGGIVGTLAVTGHVARALLFPTLSPVTANACAMSAAASAVMASPRTAGASLLLGGVLSIASWTRSPHADPATKLAPLHVGLTVAAYVAAIRLLPVPVRKLIPPNVGCAIVLAGVLRSIDRDAVGYYLDGAGAVLMTAVQPCMVTLGLYAHSHRATLRRQWRALAALSLVVAPALMLCTALAGRALQLPPDAVASVLPASTTTGLALTMPSGMPLIRHEWVALGTAFNSASVQLALPLLLWAVGLSAGAPAVRGMGVGCVAHVGGMAALTAAGETVAADAAAVALVVVGVARSVAMQVPQVTDILTRACGAPQDGNLLDSVEELERS